MDRTEGRTVSFKRTGSLFTVRNGRRKVKVGSEGVKRAALSVINMVRDN